MSISLRRSRAGRSAARRHKLLAGAWRRRVLGRRTSACVWIVCTGVYLVLWNLRLPSHWALGTGMLLGALIVAWWALPQVLMPGWISNWQEGAWGEQATAKELRRLPGGWAVRHDVAARASGNRDHVVAGPSVFLLDTKNLNDSIVTVEGGALRVTRIESPTDGYVIDRFA